MALHHIDSSDQFEVDVSKILVGNAEGNKAVLVMTVAPGGIAAEVRVNKKEYLLGCLNLGYTLPELEAIDEAGMAYARAKSDYEHSQAHILARQVVYKTAARIVGVAIIGDNVHLTVVTQGRRETYSYGAKIYSAESLAAITA